MSNIYRGTISPVEQYIEYLYSQGFKKNKFISNNDLVNVFQKIGIFKLKGYTKEVKRLDNKNIEDILIFYFFDRYFSKIIFDLTTRVEFKLKSILIDECYKRTNNHFFYLIKNNHKWHNYKIDFSTISNWKTKINKIDNKETYNHYILYYLQQHNFDANKNMYLQNTNLIDIDTKLYNYPPFKYLIESSTLGCVNSFINSLKIGNTDIYKQTASKFNLGSNKVFDNYLKRLNEIRNRVAHGGRIFNRNFRSATGIGKYQNFRKNINNHKSLDIYIFLFFMLNNLKEYNTFSEFENIHIVNMFQDFKNDYISNIESHELIKKYDNKDFERITDIIYKKMSI